MPGFAVAVLCLLGKPATDCYFASQRVTAIAAIPIKAPAIPAHPAIFAQRKVLVCTRACSMCSSHSQSSMSPRVMSSCMKCKNWYSISRTVSDNGASRQHG